MIQYNLHPINNKFEYVFNVYLYSKFSISIVFNVFNVFNIHFLHLFRPSDFHQRLNYRIASRIHVRHTIYDKRLATADIDIRLIVEQV